MKLLLKYLYLSIFGGSLYCFIEVLFRGYSHWTMFLLGAFIFVYAGLQNEGTAWEVPLWKQVLKCEWVVIASEFLTGCVVNLCLGWHVWDYSNMPFNLFGQICLPFALLFLPLCLTAILLDDLLRWLVFNEEKPHYKLK